MRHLLPSPRSNQEPRTEVAHLVLTLHRLASRPLRKATPNQGTVGTTTRENALAAVTTTSGDPTLRPPLATRLRDSRRMVTSPSPNAIVDTATTFASTAESPGTSTVTALAIHDQPSTTPSGSRAGPSHAASAQTEPANQRNNNQRRNGRNGNGQSGQRNFGRATFTITAPNPPTEPPAPAPPAPGPGNPPATQ